MIRAFFLFDIDGLDSEQTTGKKYHCDLFTDPAEQLLLSDSSVPNFLQPRGHAFHNKIKNPREKKKLAMENAKHRRYRRKRATTLIASSLKRY